MRSRSSRDATPDHQENFHDWSRLAGDSTERTEVSRYGDCMVSQMTRMHAAMNQVLAHERARHASEISLILRRVEKDLRHTFEKVESTVRTLTEHVLVLKKQVEAKAEEKEGAVSVPNAPDAGILRQQWYMEDAKSGMTGLQWVEEQERLLRDEIVQLQSKLRSYEHGQQGLLPRMQKMSSSWTRKAGVKGVPKCSDLTLPQHGDPPDRVAESVKTAQLPWPARPPNVARKQSVSRPSRAHDRTTQQSSRLLPLLQKALPPLCLLSDVFSTLRAGGCLSAVALTSGLALPAADALQTLSDVVCLFGKGAPKLQGLSGLLLMLHEEISRLEKSSSARSVTTSGKAARQSEANNEEEEDYVEDTPSESGG